MYKYTRICKNWYVLYLNVKGLLVAHHQEVTMYKYTRICKNWYVLYLNVKGLLVAHHQEVTMCRSKCNNRYVLLEKPGLPTVD
jgi:hypothetical protein